MTGVVDARGRLTPDYTQRGDDMDRRVTRLEGRLDTHEAVCAERHSATIAGLNEIRGILIKVAGGVILALLGGLTTVVWSLLGKGIH